MKKFITLYASLAAVFVFSFMNIQTGTALNQTKDSKLNASSQIKSGNLNSSGMSKDGKLNASSQTKNSNLPSQLIQLNENWFFSESGKDSWRQAVVPGTIHSHLLNYNDLLDPFYGTNEQLF